MVEWFPSFTLFIDSVTEALMKVQNLSEDEAKNTVNKAIWSYLLISIKRRYVSKEDTIAGFEAILNGDCDALPESAFMYVGTIDEVFDKAKK